MRRERHEAGDGGAGGRAGKVRRQVPQEGDEIIGVGITGRRFGDEMPGVGVVGAGGAGFEEDVGAGLAGEVASRADEAADLAQVLSSLDEEASLRREDALEDAGVAEGGGPDAGGGQEAVEAPSLVVTGQVLRAPADLVDVARSVAISVPASRRRPSRKEASERNRASAETRKPRSPSTVRLSVGSARPRRMIASPPWNDFVWE